MNWFTLALILAVVFGVGYVIDRTRRWVSSIDLSEPADDGPAPAGPQRTEPPPYEITRIVHRSGPEPEWGSFPVHYSGYRPAITESYSTASYPVDAMYPKDHDLRGRVDKNPGESISAFKDRLHDIHEQIQKIQDHERRIRTVGEDDRRRPDGEEHGRPQGGEEERRTVGPGEVRGPDPIREIRFGRI